MVATKEIGLEVNADKTKFMVMSWDQNVGWSWNVKSDKDSIEMVDEFKYLGTTLKSVMYAFQSINIKYILCIDLNLEFKLQIFMIIKMLCKHYEIA